MSNSIYESAVKGRQEMREGLRAWKKRAEDAEKSNARLTKEWNDMAESMAHANEGARIDREALEIATKARIAAENQLEAMTKSMLEHIDACLSDEQTIATLRAKLKRGAV